MVLSSSLFVSVLLLLCCYWIVFFFMSLPVGVKVPEATEKGFANSAPSKPNIGKKALVAFALATFFTIISECLIYSGWFEGFFDS